MWQNMKLYVVQKKLRNTYYLDRFLLQHVQFFSLWMSANLSWKALLINQQKTKTISSNRLYQVAFILHKQTAFSSARNLKKQFIFFMDSLEATQTKSLDLYSFKSFQKHLEYSIRALTSSGRGPSRSKSYFQTCKFRSHTKVPSWLNHQFLTVLESMLQRPPFEV